MKLWNRSICQGSSSRSFGLRGGKAGADGAVHAIGPHRDQVADRAVGDSLVQLLAGVAVADHEADRHLQILFVGLLREVEHALGRYAVGDDRLFHEDVESAVDGVLEVQPAKRERSGQDRDVARAQAVHGFLVSVEADESLVFGHANEIGTGKILLFERSVAFIETVLKDVAHRNQFGGVAGGRERVDHGAGAASAASDEGDLQFVADARLAENARHGEGRESRCCSGILNEIAAISEMLLCHGSISSMKVRDCQVILTRKASVCLSNCSNKSTFPRRTGFRADGRCGIRPRAHR